MKGPSRILVLLALLEGVARAQPAPGSAVIPPEATTREGNSADQSPFGRDRMRHIQYIHRDLLDAIPVDAAIAAISYRRDLGVSTPLAARVLPPEAKQQPTWVVRMGRFRGDVVNPPCAYPELGNADFELCFSPKPVDFPDLPALPLAPAPFAIVFPFDRPFHWKGDHLAIEHVVFHRPNVIYPYAVDAVEARGEPGTFHASAVEGGALRTSGFVGAPGGWLVLGAHAAPVRVPLGCRLRVPGPPSPGEALFPRCSDTDALGIPAASDVGGECVLELTLPRVLGFSRLELAGEWLVEPEGRALARVPMRLVVGTTTTPSAWKMSIVAGYPEAHAREGFVQQGRGLVVRLRW